MRIYSLTANRPINKSYTCHPDGSITKTSYPFVYEVLSSEHQVLSVQDLYQVVKQTASEGGCLVKGELKHALVNQSRAGATEPSQATEWICLDLDGVRSYATIDQFLCEIGAADVSYVLQWSSSMGVDPTQIPDLRCHIFMLLSTPISAPMLKLWLTDLNLRIPALRSQLSLSKSGNSLKWPLDITTCQNDKLLYVATPEFIHMMDPYAPPKKRVSLHICAKPKFSIPNISFLEEALRHRTQDVINELREKEGAPKRKYKCIIESGFEILQNPTTAQVTGIKQERGFVYLNLNGGDSWGYYHPEENDTYIHNFKGEPTYLTKELLPGYRAPVPQSPVPGSGKVILAFTDDACGLEFGCVYDSDVGDLQLSPLKTRVQMKEFLLAHGKQMPAVIPRWNLRYNPLAFNRDNVIDYTNKIINLYLVPEFMLTPGFDPDKRVASPPPVTDRLISHVLGDDIRTVNHFYNWLACLVQRPKNIGTAWVLQGTQGTGKGFLFNKILRPLLGKGNTTMQRMDQLDSQFTSCFLNKLLVFIDEMQVNDMNKDSTHKIAAKLKTVIVEDTISIRAMFREPYEAPNYSNLIFASNQRDSLKIDTGDRRFNVGAYQSKRLVISNQEIDTLATETVDFYCFLKNYPADFHLARTPLVNTARSLLININLAGIDVFTQALNDGNAEYFAEYMVGEPDKLDPLRRIAYDKYEAVTRGISEHCRTKLPKPHSIQREDIQALYSWILDTMPMTGGKFTSLMKHHNLHIKVIQVAPGSPSCRGIQVNWKPTIPEILNELKGN